MNLFFLLGADDPEMDAIESLLVKGGLSFEYAKNEGVRVRPGNAYEAETAAVSGSATLVYVECASKVIPSDRKVIVVDHHRKGDPGFGCLPEYFWEASSIGQIYSLLKLGEPTKEHLILAATDHCMVAARQGKCPGVRPEEVKMLRMKNIAKANDVDVPYVAKVVTEMHEQLMHAKMLTIGDQQVADLRDLQSGVGYSVKYLSAQEALADLGMTALLMTKDRINDPEKVVICGAVSQETIQYFIEIWAPQEGLVSIYGVPSRGYAGGYVVKR